MNAGREAVKRNELDDAVEAEAAKADTKIKVDKKIKPDEGTIKVLSDVLVHLGGEMKHAASTVWGIPEAQVSDAHTAILWKKMDKKARAAHDRITKDKAVPILMTGLGENVKDVFTRGRILHGVGNLICTGLAVTFSVQTISRLLTPA